MKITRDPIRKPQPLSAELAALVQQITNEEQCQTRDWLKLEWDFPRGDLFQYVTVLNKFDNKLETICREYQLDKSIQTTPFNQQSKQALLSILHFSKLLFDNCNNRNLYNSYEHLNNLLNTTDVDILEAVLRLMLKPAQRVNNPKAVQSSFLAHQDKVTELARGGSITDLAKDSTPNNTISMTFYKTNGKEEGLQVINIVATSNQKSDHDLCWEIIREYQVPKEYHFELLNRVRIANNSNNPLVKKQLLIIRFISIVIMAHTMSDRIAQNRVFIYEPQLVPQIAQLVSYDNHIPVDIQTYALYALDGIARHRTKVTEVLSAFNASTNHGILLHILRQLHRQNSEYTVDFVDALFTLLSFLVQTASGGAMLMSAGIMSTLIQTLSHPENKSSIFRKAMIRTVGLIDLIINNISTSFSSFWSSNGLDTLLNLIKTQVDHCIEFSDTHHDALSLVKNSLRFLIRMLESSDTAEELRNLVESSIPHTIKKVLDHPDIFGSSIYSLVINVTTTFIHSEPTSLSVLQEIQLPQTFLRSFNSYNQPVFEVLIAAVHAFGAICLNSAGLNMFNESNPLPHFFQLMTAPSFVSNTYDVGNVPALGTAMDELIRHHPSLKRSVYQFTNDLMLKVTEVGRSAESKPVDDSHRLATERLSKDPPTERADCLLLGYVDLVARYLEGFLRNTETANEFIQYNGPEILLMYYDLPYLPYDYSISTQFDSLSYVFRMFSDISPLFFAELIVKKVYSASRFMFTDLKKNKSIIYEYINSTDEAVIEKSNELFHKLNVLFGYIGLLSTVFASSILTNSKHAAKLVDWFIDRKQKYKVISLLGDIHRVMVWQNILLRESAPKGWYVRPTDSSVDLKDPRVINVWRFKLALSEIPPALMPVLQGTIKVSVSRRTSLTSEMTLVARAKQVAVQIAQLFKSSLHYMESDEDGDMPICKYDYYASMFSMISMLLLDDRTRMALETPVAVEFEDAGNIDFLVNDLLPQFWQTAEEQIKAGQENENLMQRINTCIELLLAIFHHLGSSKLFVNSPHTTILTNEKYNPGRTFEHYVWMASMQSKLLSLYKYLESPVLPKFSRHVLHSFLRCITQSLKGEGETPPRSRKLFRTQSPVPVLTIEAPSNDNNRRVLISMGFDTDSVDQALNEFGNGICALDNLFTRRLITHAQESGPPVLEISPDLESSNPLTPEEYQAALRVLVNMWYDPELAAESLSENNNLAQAALSLSQYNPSAIRIPTDHDNQTQPDVAVVDDDGDDEYEDVESEELNSEMEESDSGLEEVAEPQAASGSNQQMMDELQKVRSDLRFSIPLILAHLVDERSDLDFEVRDLMIVCCCHEGAHNEAHTRQTIDRFFGDNSGTNDKKALFECVIKRIRIFALMLRDPIMQEALPILIDRLSDLSGSFSLLELIVTYSEENTEPKWLTTVFLILEAGLAQLDEPVLESKEAETKPSNIITPENRPTLLNYCINLLKRSDFSQDSVIATLRILVRLTKHHELAVQFVESGGLEPLFMRLKTKFEILKIQQAYILMILRHVIESKSILSDCMREWFSFWFNMPTTRFLDVSTFIRNNSSLALRDPETFVNLSTQLCRLSEYNNGNFKTIRYIGNKQDTKVEEEQEVSDMMDVESSPTQPEGNKPLATETEDVSQDTATYAHLVIHFLLNELVQAQEVKEESNINTAYIGILLQCIFELVSSYPYCKYEIINFGVNPQEDVPNHNRVRQSILYQLVKKLLPYNAIDSTTDEERKKQGISTWLASLLLGMCYETTHVKNAAKSTQQDAMLTNIRKQVLDVLYYSFKDTLHSDAPASDKYNTYFALTELCYRILNARPTTILPGLNIKEETVIVVAKLMLEKNFVPLLISIVSDIDVNFPHSKVILNSVMGPLEQLTKFTIKIDNLSPEEEKRLKQKTDAANESTTTATTQGDGNGDDDEEDNNDIYIPMDTDEDDDNDAAEEEVNDLYRNSSLAMFDGTAIEEESSDESEDDMEMASSGEEIIETSDEDSDDFETVSESESDGGGEDQEMDDFMRSHRYHHTDTEDDSDENGSSDDESDDDSSSGSAESFTDNEYESANESLNSDISDSVHSEGSREVPWHLDGLNDDSPHGNRHDGHRRHRHAIQAEIMTDTDEDGLDTEASGLDDDLESDELDQEELDDVERNLALFHRGARGDPSQFIGSIRHSLNNNGGNGGSMPRTFDRDAVILHPLLRSTTSNVNIPMEGSAVPDTAILSGANSNHLQAYEDIIGGSAVRILENLLSQQHQHRSRSTLHTSENPDTPSGSSAETLAENNDLNEENKETLSILKDFQPVQTADRWTLEAQMVYTSPVASAKAAKLTNTLINRLVEIAKKDLEEGKSFDEFANSDADKQRILIPINLQDDPEEDLDDAEDSSNNGDDIDVIIEEREEGMFDEDDINEDDDEEDMQDHENEERVTVMVNGEEVDITGTGIDVEFLEALPDDLRAEVLSQQLAEHHSHFENIEMNDFSPAFLDALPPDIRHEILQQESVDRRRRQNEQSSSNRSENRNNSQQDQANDDVTVSTTNNSSSVFNETPNATWGISRHIPNLMNHNGRDNRDNRGDRSRNNNNNNRQAMIHRDAIRIVDKQQLATLARLLFVPQSISKSLLNRLLLNLCENSKTRTDLLSLLIFILHDGCTDLNAVDNCITHLYLQKGKQSATKIDKVESSKLNPLVESVPNLITQRCLEILYYVVTWNDRSLGYFLTEHNSLGSLKRQHSFSGRKNKHKSESLTTKYPILTLIGLLDQPVFSNNMALMEQLMNLLATICKPIPSIVKKYNTKLENKKPNEDDNEKSHRTLKPPVIPEQCVQKVVDVLSTGECSSHTFQFTVSILSYLSPLDSTLDSIINSLTLTANDCGKQIMTDLDQLYGILNTLVPGSELQGSALNQFSATTSQQARLLRVLKAMDYLYTRKRNQSSNQAEQNEKAVLEIYNKLDFVPLWKKLGDCLSLIQDKEDLINVASVLLPLIESFMAVSKYSSSKGYTARPSETNPAEEFFLNFTEDHKKILNILVRNNPSLMSGSFSLLIKNPKILEFDNKRNYFYQQLHKRTEPREHYGPLRLTVRRANVFEDTYRRLQGLTGNEIRYGKLNVQFLGEEGVDAGGVAREWFSVLARQMFDPNYALFITSAADKLTYQPNRASGVNSEHLSYFKCVGRIIGKAIHDGRLLDAYFTRSFYKHILGRSVDYRDVEAVDPAYYKSLVWMLENDITDIIDLTFSVETDDFGIAKVIDLKPNGRNIPVTEENKHEYVSLITEQKLVLAIKDQVNAFIEGFNDIIPTQLIQIFNEQELELLISGLPDIDIDEWKANTVYIGYTLSSPQIQWFWRAVRSFDQEERAKLLQFSTGTSKVPLEGFAQLQGSNGVQKFQIHKEFSDVNRLPSAHTCFNQIDLPQYSCYEDLRANLFKAINECSTGFAFQ